MRKFRLEADTLALETFAPAAGDVQRAGTVQAHQVGIPTLETGYHGCYACPATVLRTCVPCAE